MSQKSDQPLHDRDRARILCDSAGSILSIRVRGEIDHHTAASIRRDMDSTLFDKRPKKLILDLSAVSFMDSSGLGLIMGRYSVMKELEGEMVVWNPSPEIRSIIALAGMERMVRIEYPADSDRAPASPVKADRPRRAPAPRRPAPEGTAIQGATPPRTSPRKRKKSPAPANDPEGADRKEREA